MSALTKNNITKFIFSISFIILWVAIPNLATANEMLPSGVEEKIKCGEFESLIYSNGAGMIQGIEKIKTVNRELASVNFGENCAVVTWQTTAPATAQIIYGELKNEPVQIDLNAENYGYKNATKQNNQGNANHTAILSSLESGKAYSYRIVTRAHPTAMPIISDPLVIVMNSVTNVFPKTVVTRPSNPLFPVVVTPKSSMATTIEDVINAIVINDSNEKAVSELYRPIGLTQLKGSQEDKKELVAPAVISAVTTLDDISKERLIWSKVKNSVARVLPNNLNELRKKGIKTTNNLVIPILFFLAMLFILQKYAMPAFNFSLKNPLLYWLSGSAILAIVSAGMSYYYVSLIGIALFLSLLAFYLLQTVPEEEIKTIQPKFPELLESSSDKNKRRNI